MVIEGVWKRLGAKEVLRGVDLTVAEGESVVIIGRSGTGKSVLLKHVVGLIDPDRGAVRVDGQDVPALSVKELLDLRKRMGMLFQGGALFDSLSIAENVGLPLREHTRIAETQVDLLVHEKLHLVGLEGVETMRPSSLSGGMKKRAALARALALNPKIMLYDEPTTGLDPITADLINRLIRRLQERLGITSIAVTHDMRSAYHIADRIAMLHEGRIHAIGTPAEIQASADPAVRQFIEGSAEGPLLPT
ncbi:MAG: ATP-binding cassette domain-containing protein [Candidatus Eisenbacteria bacterium]|uniref:ATP-binding cassette domain-containing protein n=1 Tax=Eiseniibacteriota bacterium TaxID=2212470 RepID=A0A538TIE8_UNCEI|nr:MAG: ATP-binding cassette domain-containing protein [Candidatus Eisenbacteria bacterium]TMQ63389.1 MAG: ATP-binding cassette domain-containing protein [Candidatus Eisenbacteria bacterium]